MRNDIEIDVGKTNYYIYIAHREEEIELTRNAIIKLPHLMQIVFAIYQYISMSDFLNL